MNVFIQIYMFYFLFNLNYCQRTFKCDFSVSDNYDSSYACGSRGALSVDSGSPIFGTSTHEFVPNVTPQWSVTDYFSISIN